MVEGEGFEPSTAAIKQLLFHVISYCERISALDRFRFVFSSPQPELHWQDSNLRSSAVPRTGRSTRLSYNANFYNSKMGPVQGIEPW